MHGGRKDLVLQSIALSSTCENQKETSVVALSGLAKNPAKGKFL